MGMRYTTAPHEATHDLMVVTGVQMREMTRFEAFKTGQEKMRALCANQFVCDREAQPPDGMLCNCFGCDAVRRIMVLRIT